MRFTSSLRHLGTVSALAATFMASSVLSQTYDVRGGGFIANQQFRADVLDTSADPFAVGSGVLANVYQTDPGDPPESGYLNVTFDLSAFAGQNVRIRFAQVDNQGFFNAGVDNVQLLSGGMSTGAFVNGGFEANGGAGVSGFSGWTVVDEAGGSGSWFAQTGTGSPLNAFPVQAPTEGTFAAMTDQTGPGSHILYQDVAVPAGGGTLSFDLYLNNRGFDFFIPSPQNLSYTGLPPLPEAEEVPAIGVWGLLGLILLMLTAGIWMRRSV